MRLALPLSLLLCVPASSEVLVVDRVGGPGARFAEIRTAVAAAAEGDTILVRDGRYQPFVVYGKSLTVVADGPDAEVTGEVDFFSTTAINVTALSARQQVVIRGLKADLGIGVYDCEGSVWFDEVDVAGASMCTLGGVSGGHVEDSTRVTFTRCALRGENSGYLVNGAPPTTHGLDVSEGSSVFLFDCLLLGGDGVYLGPTVGGAGLRIEGSTVSIAGCTLQGGAGGVSASDPCGPNNAIGGAGVEFVGTGGVLQSAESTAVGGAKDLGALCPGQSGPQGPAISGTGTVVALAGFARHLQASSPVRVGGSLTFALEGQPGEVPFLVVSESHAPATLLACSGVLLVGLPPAEVFVLPPLPASGRASLSFPVPALSGLSEGLTFYAQALFLDPSSRLWLGAGTTICLLEAGL